MSERFFRDEDGFTTLSTTISLLLSLCLIFTMTKVYRINEASAEIQDVADAASLAAQTEVAEFMVVAETCDAVVLSLSLASAVSTGIGVVCLCVPGAVGFSANFMKLARSFAQARNEFLHASQTGLQAYQRALPFISAARAALVASSNNASRSTAYKAIALSFPFQGKDIEIADSSEADQEFFDKVDQEESQVQQKAGEAEAASQEALEAKRRGFEADCGDDPCMRERAFSLAHLAGAANPSYSSVDTWSFSVALDRARAYYRARLSNERPASSDVVEQARSVVRAQYYAFACEEMGKGYVYETESSFEAYFPTMPRNMQQMRETSLYTQRVYPVTTEDDSQTMHGWTGCPNAAGYTRMGSVQELEAGDFRECALCCFAPASLGNVAAATSSTQWGFEYHYLKVAEAAKDYQKAKAEAEPLIEQVQQSAQELFDDCMEYAKSAQIGRIKVSPPGKCGAIAVVFDCRDLAIEGNAFSGGTKALGARVAVSGAALLADSSVAGSTVITSLLDGLSDQAKEALGPASFALRCWSGVLEAYGSGQNALVSALEDTLNGLPLIGASGLGTWAAKAFRETMERLGLQPANTQALKPVLVNTGSVAAASDSSLANGYEQIKSKVTEGASAADGLLAWSSEVLIQNNQGVPLIGSSLEIAEFSPFGESGPCFTLSIPLPVRVQESIDEVLATFASGVEGAWEWLGGQKRWR